jgi:hypothetical protein
MSKRKAVPDRLNMNVMDALQGVRTNPMGRQGTAPPVKDAPNAQPNAASATVAARPKLAQQPAITNGTKMKVNLYLDSELKRRIEQTQIDLRRIAPPDQAGQINYSLIVETALALVFDEFERFGEASALSRGTIAQLKSK